MRCLVFSDVVDSTRFVQRVGDVEAARVWAEHDRRARLLCRSRGGREIDRADGFFLLFDGAADAARYAVDYHALLADLGLSARVAVHVGEVTLREAAASDVAEGAKPIEVDGLAKPFAARLMSLAGAGQTLLSDAARSALGESMVEDLWIEDCGTYRLKGIDDPAQVFALGPRESGVFTPPADTEKAYRVVRVDGVWQPLHEVKHNLSPERDAFVGRRAELQALGRSLRDSRLVSVVAAAGSGKTRLVRRFAATWRGDWPGGVYFCDLSEAKSLDGICFAVASAFEVPLGRGDPVDQLGHAIAGRGRCLVILDNFEQVTAHAPATVGRWLDRAADATFVVTSRAPLHLAGERVLSIEPLGLDSEAIELFVARARAQQADFVLADTNGAAVREIARLLDGLPLAIELAAARLAVLSPAQLIERLRDRFRLLTGHASDDSRQATLKTAIDWSWNLLTAWEQAALAQCSVFQGGFNLDAAEAVLELSRWPEAPPPIDVVQALLDKSLLRRWTAGGRVDIDEPYFGMYLTIHDYASARRVADRDADLAVQERHGRYFAAFGDEAAIESLSTRGGARRRAALEIEIDNVVVACRRALDRGDAVVAVGAYRAAWEVLEQTGPFSLGVELGAQVWALQAIPDCLRVSACCTHAAALGNVGRAKEGLASLGALIDWADQHVASHDRGRLRVVAATLSRELGGNERARTLLEEAALLDSGDSERRLELRIAMASGILESEQNRIASARPQFERALARARMVGNRHAEAASLGNLAMLLESEGRPDAARDSYEEALAIAREVHYRRFESIILANLGYIEQSQGALESARQHYRQALEITRQIGGRRWEGVVLGHMAELALLDRAGDQPLALFEASLAIDREVGHPRHEAYVLERLGTLNVECGQLDAADPQLTEALALIRSAGNRRSEASVLAVLGDLRSRQGRTDEARGFLAAGEALLREGGLRTELAHLLSVRGRVDLGAGDAVAARVALEEATDLAREMNVGDTSKLAHGIARLRQALDAVSG
jgi:predicted ATPase/class 3 adenylate cyclase